MKNNVVTILSFLFLFFTTQVQAQNCPYSDLVVDVTQCNDSIYTIVINMACENDAPDFSVFGPNGDMGNYSCDDLPITISYDGFQSPCGVFVLSIYGNNENCSISTSFQLDCCTDCYLHGFHTYGDCDDGYMYNYFINFNHQNNSDSFALETVWGLSYHSYNELPLEIESYQGGLVIWDLDNPGCVIEHYYEFIPEVSVNASVINCTEDEYYLQVTADAMGGLFILYKDGENLGVFSFLNNTIFGPYDISEAQVTLSALLVNTVSDDCEFTTVLSIENCDPYQCDFSTELGAYRCGDSLYVEGNVDAHEDTIRFYYNNILIHELSPANQIFIFDLPYSNGSQGLLTLVSAFCTETVVFNIVDCNDSPCVSQEPCYLNELTLFKHPCQTDGNFFVEVNSATDEIDGNPFTIVGNGHQYGTFKYTDLPLFLGPLCADCETNWEFMVQDIENPACYQIDNFGAVCCEPLECFIDNIEFSEQECVSTSVIEVSLNFTFSNMPSDSFNVVTFVDGQEYKWSYHYDQLPVRITDFVTNGSASQVVYVCDALNETCINTIFLELPDCSDYSCLINGLNYQIIEQDNGTFMFHLEEVYISNPDINMVVRVELNQVGFSMDININELPLDLGPFDCVQEDFLIIHIGGGVEFEECSVDIYNWMNECGGSFTQEGDLSQVRAYIPLGGTQLIVENEGKDIDQVKIVLYHMDGKIIENYNNVNIEQSKTMIDLPDMPEGMYFVRLISKDRQLPIKFAHQKF